MAKQNSKLILFLMVAFASCLGAVGQLLFKLGVNNGISLPYLVTGLAAYAIATAIYFVVLSKTHLSWSYGLNGISYIVAVFLALVVLGEKIPALRWVGVVVIAIGAALIGFS
jgi:uncharacterized membrane protein